MMEATIFFARFFGLMYIILGLLSVKGRFLGKTVERTENTLFTVSTSYVTMFLGLATVILHNVWVLDWRVVITLLGWATLIKGVLKMGFPEHIRKNAQRFKKNQTIEGIFLALLGAWLFWMSLY